MATRVGAKRTARHRRLSLQRHDEISGEQVSDDVTVYVGDAEIAALEAVGEAGVVYAHEVQNGRLQVVDMDGSGVNSSLYFR